jgi:hypothetical protein
MSGSVKTDLLALAIIWGDPVDALPSSTALSSATTTVAGTRLTGCRAILPNAELLKAATKQSVMLPRYPSDLILFINSPIADQHLLV